jgi:hypothetical protein
MAQSYGSKASRGHDSRAAEGGGILKRRLSDENPLDAFLFTSFSFCAPFKEKYARNGKLAERRRRKATGLQPQEAMTAELPKALSSRLRENFRRRFQQPSRRIPA